VNQALRTNSAWRLGTILWVLAFVTSAALADHVGPASAPSVTSQPTTTSISGDSTSTEPDAAVSRQDARSVYEAGFVDALAGRFTEALAKLERVEKIAPDEYPNVGPAIELLEAQLARRKLDERQRAREYAMAVDRVSRSLLAQESLLMPELASAAEEIGQALQEVAKTYNGIDKSESLDQADAEAAAKMKASAVKALKGAAKPLQEAVELLADNRSEYADVFRVLAGSLEEALAAYEKAWVAMDPMSAGGRVAARRRLQEVEDRLGDVLADLEVMTAEKPWAAGLLYARMAVDLSSPEDRVSEQDWYMGLVANTEAIAAKALSQARWRDAMGAYAGLAELEPDNEDYAKSLKATQRHVRVLRLYAPQSEEHGQSQPLQGESRVQPAHWREAVAGVDADMVKTAISQMDELYVTAVDYRKATHGALMGVRVLAETPQAAATFPGLADDGQRREFLEYIEKLSRSVDGRDRVDHLDLQLALNGVLRASERTVKIPVEVVAVEFMDGLLDKLDKFSSMIWPYDVPDFEKQTMGHFFGVGIQITKEEGEPLKVATPLADSPAYRAGVKTGDLIVAVDGQRTEDLSIDKLIRMITGERGTKVVLTIKRTGLLEPIDIEIIREEIHIRTVKGWRRDPDGRWDFLVDSDDKIGYIRITQFTSTTSDDLKDALESLRQAEVRSLVLDLRFDPGGLLRSAVKVADEFLKIGRIVSTQGRRTRQSENADSSGDFLDGDIVVLVNKYSASAAEIVSGALHDWRRAIIVGERTFGKGSVQNVIPIRRHSALLRLTTAYYYLPSGRLIHRRNGEKDWGVDPDVAVLMTPKQMRRWLAIRRNTDLLRAVEAEKLTDDLAEQYDADIQLSTAVLLLKLMRLQDSPTIAAAGAH